MKIPLAPPSQLELLQDITPENLLRIMGAVADPSVGGRYRHWDKLRHLPPPKGLSHLEWWLGLKMRRSGGKIVPLKDKQGELYI